jgi:hypothetical protein
LELASCYPSGAWNFDVASLFWKVCVYVNIFVRSLSVSVSPPSLCVCVCVCIYICIYIERGDMCVYIYI